MKLFLSGVNKKRAILQRLYFPRILPTLAVLRVHPARRVVLADLDRWREVRHLAGTPTQALVYLLCLHPEFRALVYWRLGAAGYVLRLFAPPLRTLHLLMPPSHVGPGLYVQHGDETFVACRRIGRNAWLNQGITVGYTSDDDYPTLGDEGTLDSGCKVLVSVTLGDGVVVGANAVVLRDVPAGATVSPPVARIVQGVRNSDG